MTTDNYQDRRRHRRIAASMPVRISTIEPERDPWTGRPFFRASQETCANVSRGGAYVQTGEPLAPGRRILLELTLPDGRPVEAIGRIAWSKRVLTPRERDVQAGHRDRVPRRRRGTILGAGKLHRRAESRPASPRTPGQPRVT